MSAIGEIQFKKAINEKNYKNVYLIYGEENYLKQQYVNILKNKIVDKSFSDFNLHLLEGKNTNISEIIQCAETLPIMSEMSCTVVHDYPLDLLTKSETVTLKEFLKDVPDTGILVFWMDSIEVNIKKNAKWRTVIKWFTDAGDSVNLEKRDNRTLCKMIVDGGKKRKCDIPVNVADYLITQVGNDLQTLLNELDKLVNYCNDRTVTKEDVDKIAVKSTEAKTFDLAKSIIKKDYDKAYSILNNLLALKEEPIVILSAISSSYVDMYRAKCAKISGCQATDASKYFNYKGKEFRLTNASRDCDRISIEQLRRSINCLSDADIALKTTSIDKKLVLEETMVKLLVISRGDKI